MSKADSDPPLAGLRVLDLTQGVSGPYATKLFADYGADVLKIERPGMGDVTRRTGPFPGDVPHPERSGLFLELNTSKRSLTLNLKTATGQRLLRELAAGVDVVFESFRPGTLARLGLSADALTERNPAATLVSVSSFGQHGPARDLVADDLLLYAASGLQAVTGTLEQGPNRIGLYAPLFYAGAVTATYAIGAVAGARRSGAGERVDASIHETLACSMDRAAQNLVALEYTGSLHRSFASNLRANAFPGGTYGGQLPCKDGYVTLMCYPHWWDRFCRMIGRPELSDDPRYVPYLADPEFGPHIDELIYPWLLEHTKAEIVARGQAEGVPVAPLNTTEDLYGDAHLRARGYWVRLEHPHAGSLELPGAPFRMLGTPARVRRAPLLGEHNAEVLRGLGYTPPETVLLRQRGII